MNFSCDIECDGAIPGEYSMTEFGIVVIDGKFDKTFHGKLAPISIKWNKEALAISGRSREETLAFPSAEDTMREAMDWIRQQLPSPTDRPRFWADTAGFDFMFWHYYAIRFIGEDIFGHSGICYKNMLQGMMNTFNVKHFIKHHKKTPHDHNPVNDAKGNAEVIWEMLKGMKK